MSVRILLAILTMALVAGPRLGAASGAIQPVLTWNELAMETVRMERLGAFAAARVYAMVNVAMYDAVNGIDVARRWSKRDFALVDPHAAPHRASRRAAAMVAAYEVLTALYPVLSDIYSTQLEDDLAGLADPPAFVAAGRQWGESVGQQVVALRQNDGSLPPEVLPGGTDPGQFRADWGSAQFSHMDPFGVASVAPFRSSGPPALNSTAYTTAFNDVKTLGDDLNVDQEKEEIVRFWRGGGGSARPPGEWIKIALTVASEQWSTRFSLSRTARLFALLGMAMGDSAVTSADSKVTYHLWRPTTAIQNAADDGNPDTIADPAWMPRNGSIGSSPEHTSGQSTFAGAGSIILANFYCRDHITFTFTGDDAIAGSRTFARFSDAATEAGRARIFAGIHFEFSNQAGQVAGRAVAQEILDTRLLPTSGRTHRGPCPR